MSMYRCAVCGSPNVKKVEGNSSFSYKKALVGTAVLGTIGAVAGINGKQNVVYHCPDCGAVLPQPMDTITKDKIEIVMIAPDDYAPKLFPTIFSDYAYLRKEKENKQAESIQKAASFSTEYANPLEITETQFRAAAQSMYAAGKQLEKCVLCRGIIEYHLASFEELKNSITDMKVISAELRNVRTITYGIPAFPSLIMQSDPTGSGLDRGNLCGAALIHIVMENGGIISLDELYDAVQINSIYQQAFMMLFGADYQRALDSKLEFMDSSDVSVDRLNADDWEWIWFKALIKPYCHIPHCFVDAPVAVGLYSGWDKRKLEFPFKLINESLNIANPTSAQKQFSVDMPELSKEITKKDQAFHQATLAIQSLRTDKASTEEQQIQGQIDALLSKKTSNGSEIEKLHKKIFGKKKANAEIEIIRQDNDAITKKIEQQSADLEASMKKRIASNHVALEEQQKMIASIKQALDDLNKQKQFYISQYPEWICIAGQDLAE